MNKIEKLIKEMCPEGVPVFPVSEFAQCIAGATPTSSVLRYWEDGTIPWMSSGEVNKGAVFQTEKLITAEAFESCSTKMLPTNTVVMALAGQGKTRGMVARTRIPLCTNQSLCGIIPDATMNSDFLYHYLKSQYRELRDMSSGDGGRGGLNLEIVRSVIVPVPPLKVQLEIALILDKFTELEAELEAELDARSNQYESYRDALLDFRAENTAHPLKSFLGGSTLEGVEWVAIGNLGELFPGLSGKSKEDFSNGNRPFVSYLDIGNNASLPREIVSKVAVGLGERQNEIKLGDILFTGSSEDKVGVGLTSEVEYEPDEPTYLNSFCFGLRPEPGRFAKGFLKHLFRSSGIRQKVIACGNGVTRINISKKLLLKVEVPQPPLALQEAIVSILDKLDSIVTGTQASLPAEIQARRKQYEYYRNKLLTFKELDAA